MLKAALFLALLGTVLAGGDSFTKKYAYNKIMSNCFGKEAYNGFTKLVHKLSIECKKEIYEKMKEGKEPDVPVNPAPLASFFDTLRAGSGGQPQYIPIPVYYQSSQAGNPYLQFQRQKRDAHGEAMYSGELLKKMVKKVKVKVGTLMCVLKKIGNIDENKNINIAVIKEWTEKFTTSLDV